MLLPIKSLNVTFSPFSSLWPLSLDRSHIEILFFLCPFGKRIPPPAHPLLCFSRCKNGHFCMQHHLQSDICLCILSLFLHLDNLKLLDRIFVISFSSSMKNCLIVKRVFLFNLVMKCSFLFSVWFFPYSCWYCKLHICRDTCVCSIWCCRLLSSFSCLWTGEHFRWRRAAGGRAMSAYPTGILITLNSVNKIQGLYINIE